MKPEREQLIQYHQQVRTQVPCQIASGAQHCQSTCRVDHRMRDTWQADVTQYATGYPRRQ